MSQPYESNVYYYPETWDLEVVGEADERDMSYEYNTFVVWRHKLSGKYYCAQDSGCSCPTPFERFERLSDLTELDSYNQLKALLDAWVGEPYYTRDTSVENRRQPARDLLERCENLWNR